MFVAELLDDREAKTGTFIVAVPLKGLCQFIQLSGAHPGPCIADANLDPVPVPPASDQDFSVLRILNCVGREVGEDSHQCQWVGMDLRATVDKPQVQPLGLRLMAQHLLQVMEQVLQG